MPQRPGQPVVDPVDALLNQIDQTIGAPPAAAPDPTDAMLADIDKALASPIAPARPSYASMADTIKAPAGAPVSSETMPGGFSFSGTRAIAPGEPLPAPYRQPEDIAAQALGPSLNEVVEAKKKGLTLPLDTRDPTAAAALSGRSLGTVPPATTPTFMDNVSAAASVAARHNPVLPALKSVSDLVTGASGTFLDAPTAAGETLFNQPLPGHEGEPSSFVGRLASHAQMILDGRGGEVSPIGLVKAMTNPPDTVSHTSDVEQMAMGTLGSNVIPTDRVRGKKELLAEETARRGMDMAAKLFTDPVSVATMGIEGVAGDLLAAAFTAQGVQSAAQVASNPNATPEDVAESLVNVAVLAIPAAARYVIPKFREAQQALYEKTRAMADAAEARRQAARTITPEPTDIPVTPERSRLPQEAPIGQAPTPDAVISAIDDAIGSSEPRPPQNPTTQAPPVAAGPGASESVGPVAPRPVPPSDAAAAAQTTPAPHPVDTVIQKIDDTLGTGEAPDAKAADETQEQGPARFNEAPDTTKGYDAINDHERRELRRMLVEMENQPFTKHTFLTDIVGHGGSSEIVPGAGGAPVFNDVGANTRADVIKAIQRVLDGTKAPTMVGKRAIDVARKRLRGDWHVSEPTLPPDAGDEPGKTYVDRTPDMTAEELAVEKPFREAVEQRTPEMVAEYVKRFGNVVDADKAKELSPEYDASNETRGKFNRAVHRSSSRLAFAVYDHLLQQPTPEGKDPVVDFIAGPTGAGKSRTIDAMKPALARSQVIVDGPLTDVGNAQIRIQKAIDAGKSVHVVYVHRDPVEAWHAGVLPRAEATGRQTPLDYHVRSHVEGLRTIHVLAHEYADHPNVSFEYLENRKGEPVKEITLADLPEAYNGQDVRAGIEARATAEKPDVGGARQEGEEGRDRGPQPNLGGVPGSAPRGVSAGEAGRPEVAAPPAAPAPQPSAPSIPVTPRAKKDEPPKIKNPRSINEAFLAALKPFKGSDGKWYYVDTRQPDFRNVNTLDADGFPQKVRGYYPGSGFYRDDIPGVTFEGSYERPAGSGEAEPTGPTKTAKPAAPQSSKDLAADIMAEVEAERTGTPPAPKAANKPAVPVTPKALSPKDARKAAIEKLRAHLRTEDPDFMRSPDDKVAKLLRLAANNPNPHEAAAAKARAEKLIAEYQLTAPGPLPPTTFTKLRDAYDKITETILMAEMRRQPVSAEQRATQAALKARLDAGNRYVARYPDRGDEPRFARKPKEERTVDLFDTGEEQPRLPGAEDVREQEIATPELDRNDDFRLTPEVGRRKGKQSALFARKGSPDGPRHIDESPFGGLLYNEIGASDEQLNALAQEPGARRLVTAGLDALRTVLKAFPSLTIGETGVLVADEAMGVYVPPTYLPNTRDGAIFLNPFEAARVSKRTPESAASVLLNAILHETVHAVYPGADGEDFAYKLALHYAELGATAERRILKQLTGAYRAGGISGLLNQHRLAPDVQAAVRRYESLFGPNSGTHGARRPEGRYVRRPESGSGDEGSAPERVGPHQPHPVTLDAVTLMVDVVKSYIDEGVSFPDAVRAFQEDFGDGSRALDRHFELAWKKLTGTEGRVADVLPGAGEAEKPREFSSTQIELPKTVADRIKALADEIPDADLAEDGREEHPHVTVKFGLHTNDVADVRRVLADEKPITVTLGKTSIFPAKDGADYDVVKVDVDSPDLHRLNAKIAGALEHTDTHPTYKPHVTIAYVKAGLGKKYVGLTDLEGFTVAVDAVTFSGKDRQVIAIPLGGEKTPKAPVPVTPRGEPAAVADRPYDNYGNAHTAASKLFDVFTIGNLPKNNIEMKAAVAKAMPTVDPNENTILNAATDAIEARLAATLGGPNMADAHKLEAMLTRAYRTPEKSRLQQFSTPLPIAVAVVQAAQLRRADRVLEPTAGTGNLIAPTKGSGAAVTAIEMDPSRVSLLKAQGWNAVQANYLTYPVTKGAYDVIVTNPPWGKYSTGKYGQAIAGTFTPGDVAERFIAKNVLELKAGGRLVAVMPTTMLGASGAPFRGFLDKHGTVRAIIKSPPHAYDTRGTSVESVLLVFDKGGVTLPAGDKVVNLDTKDWQDYTDSVGRVADRAQSQRTGVVPVTPKADERPAGAGARSTGSGSGGVSGAAGNAVRPQAGERPAGVVAGVQPGHEGALEDPVRIPKPPARAAGTDATRGFSDASLDAYRKAESSDRFSPYRLRTTLDGVRHPRVMVEARGLAGVEYPDLVYDPSARFKKIIADGRASIEQGEQALAAVQANAVEHHGYLAADNVGVGKAREAWLSIIELMERAKAAGQDLRLMVTTKNADNIESLITGELPALVGQAPGFEVFRVSDYKGSRQKPGKTEPVEPLPQPSHAVYVVDSYNLAPYREALLDAGLHGIIGDEAHRFKNAEASVGAAWQQLHAHIFASVPRAQQAFVYFTATPAQAVEDYAYLYGLRLWPIDGFRDWVDMVTGQATEAEAKDIRDAAEAGGYDIKAVAENDGDSVVGGDSEDTGRSTRGVMSSGDVFTSRLTPAEGEQITREWKRMGRFSSRDLWREGTEFVVQTEHAGQPAVQRYDDFTTLARAIIAAAEKFGKMNKAIRSGIGGVKSQLQFAAKRVQMQPSLEAGVRLAKEHLATGHQVVLSLINVSEFDAEQGNIAAAINQINIHDIDTTKDGEIIDNGEIPEALQARAELLEQAAALGKLPSPVTYIEEQLGPENVAFVIGQSKSREKHVAEFQEGKRGVAVISAAGSTGISLDHRVKTPTGAHGRRVFIDVQFDWSATEAIQRYGRVDRASQISAPKIIALNFGTAAEKKFLSTIANRLASLGALSKGGSETTGTDLEEFEIDGNEATAAARNAWNALPDETKNLFTGRLFRDPKFPAKPANRTQASIKDIMLSLLFVPTKEANAFWKDFIAERDRLREMMSAGAERRTRASVGQVLRSIELTPELTLHQVKNAIGERMGILSGVVMPEMPRIRDFLRDRDGNISRRYTAFTAGDQIVAGLVIPWGRVPGLAKFYGRALKADKLDTPEKVREALRAGDALDLQQKDDRGNPWKLRQRRDDKIAVDGVKMSDRVLVTKHGVGYNAAGNWWEARDLAAFLERFPLAAPRMEATADELEQDDDSDGVNSMPWTSGTSAPLPPKRGGPVPVTDRMRPSAILEKLRKGLGAIPISVGRFHQQAYGIYKQKPQAVRTRVANDVQTIAHELGHHVDHTILGISRKDKRWRDELQALGQATSRPSYTTGQQRQEGAAEFFRLYLIDPAKAQAEAPAYFAEFEARLDEHPDLKTVLHDARTDLAGLIAQDPATRGKLRIDFTGDDSPSLYRLLKDDPKGAMQRLATLWSDDLHALHAAVEEMRDLRPLDARQNAYILARNARGTGGMAEGMLEHGIRGRNGRFLTGSFADAITPVKEHLEDFAAYLVARRVLEVQRLKGKETGMTTEEARGIVREVENGPHAAAMARARDNVYAYNRALLQYAKEYHALSDDQYRDLLKEVDYVPLQRVSDAVGGAFPGGGGARKIANRTSPIKRMKGSGRDIVNPIESIIRNTFTIVDMVEKNRAMQALVRQADKSAGSAKWLERVPTPQVATKFNLSQVEKEIRAELDAAGIDLPDNFDLDAFVKVFTPANFALPGQNLVTVIRDGKREFYEVHDQALFDAITAIGGQATSKLVEWASKPAALLRAGATLTPGFIARNPTRDTLVAFIQSRYGFIPGYDTLRGLLSLVMDDADAKLFLTSGVQQSALVGMDRDRLRKKIAAMTESGKIAFFKHIALHPVDLLRALSENMESATRLGEFRLALNAGGTERRAGVLGIMQRLATPNARQTDDETLTRATSAARDVTTDFSRGGSISREANRVYAFFNAKVQGFVRMAETLKRDPTGTLLTVALLAMLSYYLWWLNSDDQHYDELPDWEKNAYWHIPIGVGKKRGFIKVAKPFEWALLPNLVEATLSHVRKHDPDAFNRMRPTDAQNMAFALIPSALLPITEAAFNYDTFRDAPIVKPWDVGLDPQLQRSEWTTDTAVEIGKLLGVAPAKVDHIIFGYGAGFARGVVEHGTDPALHLSGLIKPKRVQDPAKKWQRVPVVGTFYREGAYDSGAQSLKDFYDEYNRVINGQRSMGRFVKAGDKAAAVEFAKDTAGERWRHRGEVIKLAKKELENLGGVVNAIYAAPPSKATPEQKRQALDRTYEQMVDIARRALGRPPLRRGGGHVPVTSKPAAR